MVIGIQEIKSAVKEALAEENAAGIQPIIIPPLADEVCQALENGNAGGRTADSAVGTSEVVDKFLASKKSGIRAASLESYRDVLRQFFRVFPEFPMEPEPIEEYLAQFNNANTTAQHKFNVLRVFYNWANNRLGLPNPMKKITKPAGEAKEVMPLDKKQARALLDATRPDRVRGEVFLYLGQGFRLSEVSRLDVEDIGEDRIRVHGKRRTEWMPLLSEVRDVLLELADGRGPKEPVFIGQRGRLSASQIQFDIKQLFMRAGINGGQQSPHTLRHTFETLAANEGCDGYSLARLMRHKTGTMTERYFHPSLNDLKEKLERYSPLRILNRPPETFGKKPDYAQG